MIKQIANLITLCNLLCGCLSITYTANNDLKTAAWLILAATVFDFFDGFVARLLKADGEMGKQLDSLCDVVSFGVAPGYIWYMLMQTQGMCSAEGFCINKYVWLAIPLSAAYRLAKFNIDTRQTTGFLGVPTPMSGIVLAGIALAIVEQSALSGWYQGFYVLLLLPFFIGFMAISELPMLSLKFKKGDKENVFKIALVVLSVLLAVVLRWDAFAGIYLLFLILSLISTFVKRSNSANG